MTSNTPASPATPSSITNDRRRRLSTSIGGVASIAILSVALWFLHKELAGLSKAAILAHIRSIPLWALFASTGFAVCSYLVLTAYDVIALRYLNRKVPYKRVALTAFMAYAVGHNVGFVALSGGSIRYRMYSLAGLTASEIARLVVFLTVTFGLGAATLLGGSLLLTPATQTSVLNLPSIVVTSAGIVLLLIPILYAGFTVLRRDPVRLGDWQIAVPRPSIAASQMVVSIGDLMFASATLYVLLEPVLHIGYFPFLGIFLLAMAAGLVSSVPGGLGVFEAVLVAALPQVDTTVLLGTAIVYRLIYYVMPLALALLLLVGQVVRQHDRVIGKSMSMAGDWISIVAPQIIGAMIFLAGLVLLVSGASTAVQSRLTLVSEAVPLPLLELSHLAGSVVGTGLLILAHGLYRRLHIAYLVAFAALFAGIVISITKGLDYEEALLLATILTVLWLSRREFYRLESIADQPMSAQWIVAIGVVLSVGLWVGMVSFRHVEYANKLWWQFAADAEAPRMLRAALLAAVTALSFALWKTFRGKGGVPIPASVTLENERVRSIVAKASHSIANASLMGDKRFLWSDDKEAFIMYQVSGRSWIALGDPVGPEGHQAELVWAFRELVDRHDGRTVFYEVSDKFLSFYVDLGLTLSKLGEEARVPLEGFTLQGSQRAELRQACNKARKHGAVFEVIPRANVSPVLSELRRISESWLGDKQSAEKGFSLGFFSESYVENFDCAVVRVDGDIVAFANLWPAPTGGELSIDLMRYDQRAPKGIMDYLFIELILWGTANGYRWFNLGMAPLAGLEQRPLAPLWHKLGHLIYSHGENFYNFEGLRNYKEKFDPEWQPRYLACPGGWLHLPAALFDASRLISGGTAAILVK